MPKPCRITVFEDRRVGKQVKHVAYQLLEPHFYDPVRLPGAGSFYWPSPRAAWRRATVVAREPGVTQVKVETISGAPVGRIFADGRAYACDAREREF